MPALQTKSGNHLNRFFYNPSATGLAKTRFPFPSMLLGCLLLVLVFGTTACAQDKPQLDPAAEIDKLFSWATPNTPGCACAVSQNGKIVLNRAYGSADLEREVAISTETVFDAGSVVKQFVAAAVLILAEEGRLSLADDVRKYVPELPATSQKITLDHLLTHTSGVRDWTGIRPMTEGDPDALTLTLRQRGLNFTPGEEWAYSNSGYVLLKEIVARVSGMSFSEFSKKYLFTPLKMNATNYLADLTDVVKKRAQAYKMDGLRWKLDMYFGNDRGGGGALMSTAADLVLWNDALTNKTLGNYVTGKLQEAARLNNGRQLGYARGLNLDNRNGDNLVWHSGGAAGYSTLVARLPERGLSIAIMCNADGAAKSMYASRIFDMFLPSAGNENSTRPANTVAPIQAKIDLSQRTGLFFNEATGQPLRLAEQNNTLLIIGVGPLLTLDSNRFSNKRASLSSFSQAIFELEFISPARFVIKTKEGAKETYRRAITFSPNEEALKIFAGQYESDETGSLMEMIPSKGGVIMRFVRNPAKALEFSPVDSNTFMMGMMTIRFIEDKARKVIGFAYSNPLVRNIRFTRLKECK